MRSPFDPAELRSLMRGKDIYCYDIDPAEKALSERFDSAATVINDEHFEVQLAETTKIRRELVFKPARFEDALYLRHLNRRLLKLYHIQHPSRNDISRQVIQLMQCDTPLTIARLDIRRFFRNVDFDHLVYTLRLDGRLTAQELSSLSKISQVTTSKQGGGLPWGLPLSSTLAEIYALPLDTAVRGIPGVFYYQRFVDDIIVFSTCPARTIISSVKSHLDKLPKPLRLNNRKTHLIEEVLDKPATTSFDYLGYCYTRPSVTKMGTPTKLMITIADRKVERLKSKIHSAIRRYYVDGSLFPLTDRIKLITGNYRIRKSKHSETIKTGIYYNYRYINDFAQLDELDSYLKDQIITLRCSCRRRKRYAPGRLFKRILKLSFRAGFDRRLMHEFSRSQLEILARGWKHDGR